MLGVIGDLVPNLSHGETLEELCERHCYDSSYVQGSYILMCDIYILSNHVVVVMVPRILVSFGNHKISGGQLHMVASAMGGTYFGWAQMYLFAVRHALNHTKAIDGEFYFTSFMCSFFFKRVSTL